MSSDGTKYLLNCDFWPLLHTYGRRCLRLVSQSWHAFVDDSMYLTKIEKIDCKRQRTSRDISSARASSSKEYKNGSGCDKEAKNSQKLFLDAKVCLYSLKRTVEDLQKKGLFPYNPKPLLRRFVIWPWLLLFSLFATTLKSYFAADFASSIPFGILIKWHWQPNNWIATFGLPFSLDLNLVNDILACQAFYCTRISC